MLTATVEVPAARPSVLTDTLICELLVMLPLAGDTEIQLALSDAVQLVGFLFGFENVTD